MIPVEVVSNTKQLIGAIKEKFVRSLRAKNQRELEIQFDDGSILTIEAEDEPDGPCLCFSMDTNEGWV